MGNALEKATQRSESIPSGYKERGEWFASKYGKTLASHVANLCRFCGHLPKGQAVSYTEITGDGYVHAHYGRYSVYFPADDLGESVSPLEWMNRYGLEIDGKSVELDSGIQEVQDEMRLRAEEALLTGTQRLVNKLLPPKVEHPRPTSRMSVIKRSLKIRRK